MAKKGRRMKRRKGIFWEYNGDGMFESERIKGFWKRYWCKWDLRRTLNLAKKEDYCG